MLGVQRIEGTDSNRISLSYSNRNGDSRAHTGIHVVDRLDKLSTKRLCPLCEYKEPAITITLSIFNNNFESPRSAGNDKRRLHETG